MGEGERFIEETIQVLYEFFIRPLTGPILGEKSSKKQKPEENELYTSSIPPPYKIEPKDNRIKYND